MLAPLLMLAPLFDVGPLCVMLAPECIAIVPVSIQLAVCYLHMCGVVCSVVYYRLVVKTESC